ncbi:MAG: response regulator transcription factor [Tahibacter sp.]
MSQSILIVDDEPPMQERLRRILEGLDLGQPNLCFANSVAQAKAIGSRENLMLGLIDLGLPDGHGIEIIQWLRDRGELLPLVVISAWSTEEMILGALRAGASGYLLKERDDPEIALSLVNVLKGGAPIDPFIARRILGLIGVSVGTGNKGDSESDVVLRESLTKRELTILSHVAKGLSNREIAALLSLSRWTVDTHIRHIYGKLAVNSRTQAVRAAQLHKLLN